MLLQTLSTPDPDELAAGFRRWRLRFRQLGGGSFRGELKFLQLGRIQIIHASGNRRLQALGSLPPGSFGFAPVLPRNAGAIWRGRRCTTQRPHRPHRRRQVGRRRQAHRGPDLPQGGAEAIRNLLGVHNGAPVTRSV